MPNRVVIGSEIDDERKIELEEAGAKYAMPIIPLNSSGDPIPMASSMITEEYDAIYLTYSGSNISTVVYKWSNCCYSDT